MQFVYDVLHVSYAAPVLVSVAGIVTARAVVRNVVVGMAARVRALRTFGNLIAAARAGTDDAFDTARGEIADVCARGDTTAERADVVDPADNTGARELSETRDVAACAPHTKTIPIKIAIIFFISLA